MFLGNLHAQYDSGNRHYVEKKDICTGAVYISHLCLVYDLHLTPVQSVELSNIKRKLLNGFELADYKDLTDLAAGIG